MPRRTAAAERRQAWPGLRSGGRAGGRRDHQRGRTTGVDDDVPVRVVTRPIGLNLINQTTTSTATSADRWDIVYRSSPPSSSSPAPPSFQLAGKDLTTTATTRGGGGWARSAPTGS